MVRSLETDAEHVDDLPTFDFLVVSLDQTEDEAAFLRQQRSVGEFNVFTGYDRIRICFSGRMSEVAAGLHIRCNKTKRQLMSPRLPYSAIAERQLRDSAYRALSDVRALRFRVLPWSRSAAASCIQRQSWRMTRSAFGSPAARSPPPSGPGLRGPARRALTGF